MILQNQVKCGICGDTPYSSHVHDFKRCKCRAVAVDGGLSYLRRAGEFLKSEEMSIEMEDALVHKITFELDEAQKTGRNSFGLLCVVMRGLRDAGYEVNK